MKRTGTMNISSTTHFFCRIDGMGGGRLEDDGMGGGRLTPSLEGLGGGRLHNDGMGGGR